MNGLSNQLTSGMRGEKMLYVHGIICRFTKSLFCFQVKLKVMLIDGSSGVDDTKFSFVHRQVSTSIFMVLFKVKVIKMTHGLKRMNCTLDMTVDLIKDNIIQVHHLGQVSNAFFIDMFIRSSVILGGSETSWV